MNQTNREMLLITDSKIKTRETISYTKGWQHVSSSIISLSLILLTDSSQQYLIGLERPLLIMVWQAPPVHTAALIRTLLNEMSLHILILLACIKPCSLKLLSILWC